MVSPKHWDLQSVTIGPSVFVCNKLTSIPSQPTLIPPHGRITGIDKERPPRWVLVVEKEVCLEVVLSEADWPGDDFDLTVSGYVHDALCLWNTGRPGAGRRHPHHC